MNESRETEKINFYDIISPYIIESKEAFEAYWHEIWIDLSNQSWEPKKGVSRTVFSYYYELPEIINKQLFQLFDLDSNGYWNAIEFISGMMSWFCTGFVDWAGLIFSLYDYNKDDKISKNDIRLILNYIPIVSKHEHYWSDMKYEDIDYNDRVESQKEIFMYWKTSFDNEEYINKKQFIDIIVNKSSDIFIILYLYLNKQRPFNKEILKWYTLDTDVVTPKNDKYLIAKPSWTSKFAAHIVKKRWSKWNKKVTFGNQTIQGTNVSVPFYYKRAFSRKSSESKDDSINSSKKKDTSEEIVSSFNRLGDSYSGFIFKITKEQILKVYWFMIIKLDLFYYLNKNDKQHLGMHHWSNTFLTKNPNKVFKGVNLRSFSLIFPRKTREFFIDKEDEYHNITNQFYKNWNNFDIANSYSFRETVTQGKFGPIINAIHIQSERVVVIKQIEKKKMSITDQKLMKTNIEILKISQHKNLIQLYDIFENSEFIYLVLEKCDGKDLFTYIEKRNYKLPEKRVAQLIHQLLCAVYYIHSFGVVHRDIKPENILMTDDTDHAEIKLVDFGLSKIISEGEKCKEPYGTWSYVSPEILLEKPYKYGVDAWSVGVLTYLLLRGSWPFDDDHSEREIARQTIHVPVSFKKDFWKEMSNEVIVFIEALLVKEESKRMGIKEAWMHDWIGLFYPQDVANRKDYIKNKNKSEFKSFTSIGNK